MEWVGREGGRESRATCTIDHNPVYTNTWWTSHTATMSTDIKREYGALINLSDSGWGRSENRTLGLKRSWHSTRGVRWEGRVSG